MLCMLVVTDRLMQEMMAILFPIMVEVLAQRELDV